MSSPFRTSAAGSTARLLQLCAGYFVCYVLTGTLVKVFTGGIREPRMSELAYLFNNTLGSSFFCIGIVVALGWLRLRSNRMVRFGPWKVPAEAGYIVPSGICTAIIIPTTTLMYTLPISVMVAMVIMRGSVIVISRLVDEAQIRQGLLHRKVHWGENWAVVFALMAVGVNVLLMPVAGLLEDRGVGAYAALGLSPAAARGSFDFLRSGAAMTIMGFYVVAYGARIYIMNYFKNTRGQGVKQDNRGFFAIEQVSASVTMGVAIVVIAAGPTLLGWSDPRVLELAAAVRHPDPIALLSGLPYGLVAFFSVFIFMFQGRTATFAGLANRLTSLVAGTAATMLMFWTLGQDPPKVQDWVSLAFILVAVAFMARAERSRPKVVESPVSTAGASPEFVHRDA